MKLRLCDFLTLMNAAFGLVAILKVLSNQLCAAPFFLLAAVMFDFLDGKVARAMKTESKLGKQLDSLADVISFGIAPVVFGFAQIRTGFAIFAFTAYLMAGILRLARFNVQTDRGVYHGMPIPWGAVFVSIAFLSGLPLSYYPYLFLVFAALMISPFRIRKLIK